MMFIIITIRLFVSYLLFLTTDLFPDDSECDWPANELLGDSPWLLVGGHLGETETCSHCQSLAQILSFPVHLHDLSVPVVCGYTSCPLYRYVCIVSPLTTWDFCPKLLNSSNSIFLSHGITDKTSHNLTLPDDKMQ